MVTWLMWVWETRANVSGGVVGDGISSCVSDVFVLGEFSNACLDLMRDGQNRVARHCAPLTQVELCVLTD